MMIILPMKRAGASVRPAKPIEFERQNRAGQAKSKSTSSQQVILNRNERVFRRGFLPNVGNLLAFEATARFAEQPDGWLVLTGTYGCGKTHLAAAVTNAMNFASADAFSTACCAT